MHAQFTGTIYVRYIKTFLIARYYNHLYSRLLVVNRKKILTKLGNKYIYIYIYIYTTVQSFTSQQTVSRKHSDPS